MIKILLIICLSLSLYGSTISDAKKLFDEDKNYKNAITIFQNYPNNGEALYYLGKANLYGLGIERNSTKAIGYLQQSSSYNNAKSMVEMAKVFAGAVKVQNVKIDSSKTIIWLKKAITNGSIEAIRFLGNIYASKEISNHDEAIKYYKLAIEKEDLKAYKKLAELYYVQYKDIKAISYYKKFLIYYPDDIDALNEIAYIYLGLKEYKDAYTYLIKAADLNSTLAIQRIYSFYKNKTEIISDDDLLSLLEKVSELSDKSAVFFLHQVYMLDYNKYKKAHELALKHYKNGNIEMGCNVASYFGNKLFYNGHKYINNTEYNLLKAYEISNKIINENVKSKDQLSCYSVLTNMYRKGDYLSKDINKALDIYKELFEMRDKRLVHYDSKSIAEIYMEELKDYDNARKWYKITYDLTKDKKYLTIVDEYIKKQPIYKIDKKQEQAIYPIIENFTDKDQVINVLETDKYYFISLTNRSINMYNKNDLELLKTFRGWIGVGLNGATSQMAYDKNKKLLYCTGMNSSTDFSQNDIIKVFDIKSGKVVKTIDNKNAIKSIYLNISKDGKYLVSINQGQYLNIINIDTNEIQHYNFSNIASFTKANIIKKDDDYLVNVLGKDNILYTFSVNKKRQIKKELFRFQTTFKQFNGIHRENILKNSNKILTISDINLDKNILNIKTKEQDKILNYNFKTLSLNNSDDFKSFNTNSNSNIALKYKNYGSTVELYKNNNYLTSLEFYDVKALSHKIIDDKYIIVTTSDVAAMYIFNLKGRAIAKIDGINSIQRDIIYKDGYLISYGKDNIINIFNLKELDEYEKLPKTYDKEILSGFSKTTGGDPLKMLNKSDEDIKNLIKLQVKASDLSYMPTPTQIRTYFKMLISKKQVIIPTASLYIKNKKDWIIYTPEGLFTYGGEGHKLLKYHQNQGLKKEAKIVENEKLFDKFYRPDLIKKILAGKKVDIPMDVKSVILNILPPELKILVNKMLNNKDIELTYEICDAGNGISNPKLVINGQAINPPSSRGFSIEKIKSKDEKCKVYKSTHTLYPGKSTIELKAYDKDKNIVNTSQKIEINANYKIIEKSNISYGKNTSIDDSMENAIILDKQNLYLLSLAVSDYKDNSYDLNYPVKDVSAIKEQFLTKSKKTFENIYTYELNNDKVSIENIDKIFDEIAQKIKMNDTFVLYLAGHGTTVDGKYQFIPYEITDKVSIDNLKENLSKIAANTNKSLVMLDTCYSGTIIDNINDEATKNRLAYDSTINYIVASSSDQVALEGYKDHGIFTYSILDAFENNSNLKVWGLADHVSEIVPKITQEKFHFQQIPQAKLNKNFELVGGKD